MKSQFEMKSPLGPLFLVASETGLQGIFFNRQKIKTVKSLSNPNPTVAFLAQARQQLSEYFAGKRSQFDVRLDLQGTEFQVKVWKQLLKIPFGKTLSYKDVAQKINNAKATRAVGTANGKNPVCIMVPCHRVIAASGKLGGYSGGLAKKIKLLNIENIQITK